MSDTTPGAANLRDIRDALTAIRDAANEHQPVGRHHIITIRDRADALDAARRDAEARAEAAERDLKEAEDRGDRYFKALIRALPGHYDHVLWMAYTLDRPAVFDKREEWRKSDKCKVARFDGEHWLRSLGLQDGDWHTVKAGDIAEPAPVEVRR